MKKMMLYAKEDTVVPSNEEQVDTALLIIDEDGTVTGVTDKTKLNGTLALPAEIYKIKEQAFEGCTGLTGGDFSACTNLTEIGGLAFANISPTARFIVATEAVKELVINSVSGIKDEQITVKK